MSINLTFKRIAKENMKKVIVLLICVLISTFGCKENEPTAPQEETPIEKAIVEATIGPNGGILETDDFKLVVPDGAFLSNTNLKLYIESEEAPLGEYSVSNLYRILGIPENLQASLKISIKYNGSLSGVNFISLGREDTIELLDTTFVDIVYSLIDAEELNGFLNAEIKFGLLNKSGLNKVNDTETEIILTALTGGKNEPCRDHFKIKGIIPKGQEESGRKICEYFEEAYTRFKEAEFDYSNISWPLEIKFIPISKEYWFGSTSCGGLSNFDIFYHDNIELSNSLRKDIVEEFILVVLSSYENWENYMNLNGFRRWAQFQFGIDIKDKKFIVTELYVDGIYNNGLSYYWDTASFLDYISEIYGENKIAQICESQKPFAIALTNLLGDPKSNKWLMNFYEYIFTSSKYEEISNVFLQEKSRSKIIIDGNFSTISHTQEYEAQSVVWYEIQLNDEFDESSNLKFTSNLATSGISIVTFKENILENRRFIKNGFGEVVLTNIKKLKDEGNSLFVLITNNEYDPIDKINTIKLTIEKNDDLIITGCSVFLRYLTGDYIKEYPIGTFATISDASLGMGFPKDKPDAEVNFSGRVLTQKYTDFQFSDGFYYSGDISITFGEDDGKINMDYISSITAKWKRAEKLDSREHSYENELSAINIPIDKSVSYLKYKLSGEDICSGNKIVSLNSYENHRTVIYTLINGTWKCNEDSELEVFISTQ